MKKGVSKSHQKGEPQKSLVAQSIDRVAVDTYGGRVHIDWDHNAPVTPFGQLAFFIEFLKITELFDHYVESCPLSFTSPNAPSKRDVLGTILFSVLAGHTRYAHMTTVRTDKVNPPLLGMEKIVSDDSVRRGLTKIPEESGRDWLMESLKKSYSEILSIPWICDVDTTVKCLYGHQEGAVVGYNPRKPGRPSHQYHSYMIAGIRMILDVEVMPGNESSAKHTLPYLFSWLDSIAIAQRPQFIRGDCNFGTDAVMTACEERQQPYLFKLKQTPNIKRFISQKMVGSDWVTAGQGWEGTEGFLKLMGWEEERRVVVLRRKIKKEVGVLQKNALSGQAEFHFAEMGEDMQVYEYAALATSLEDEILTITQHYRDRADSENNFDELKNQWGWAGYTTHDLHRCQLMARIIALIYNWWTLFVRVINPSHHLEAITSRPLLLYAVGRQVHHAGQKIIQVSSGHADFKKLQPALSGVSDFFKKLMAGAEQSSPKERIFQILYRAFKKFMDSVQLKPEKLLLSPG